MKVAIIPAAGKGARFYELGRLYPKCMLPYEGRPIIDHIIEKIRPHVDEIRVVVNDDHFEMISQHITGHDIKVRKVSINLPQGPASSMFTGVDGDEHHVVVVLSDAIVDVDYGLICNYDTITAMTVSDPSRWCMVSNHPLTFYDKPVDAVPTDLALTGIYSFTRSDLLYEVTRAYLMMTTGETQFSPVLEAYHATQRISVTQHRSTQFIDLGTLEAYLKNKAPQKSRWFNDIRIVGNRVTKTSLIESDDFVREMNWMQNPMPDFEEFLPKIYSMNYYDYSYEMEKLRSTNLRDVFLYFDRSYVTWTMIFKRVAEFIDRCKNTREPSRTPRFWEKIIKKTASRAPNEHEFVNLMTDVIEDSEWANEVSFYHGDLHFANMFYCFTYDDLKLIDPRGEHRGHWLYDVAKLYHSVYGLYDFIDSGLYTNVYYDKGIHEVQRAFEDVIISNLSEDERNFVILLTASLFLSMIPLHSDQPEHQDRFFATYQRMLDMYYESK